MSQQPGNSVQDERRGRSPSPISRAELAAMLDELVTAYDRFPTSETQVQIKALRGRINRMDARAQDKPGVPDAPVEGAGIADHF
jgi:hypothetical protein